MSYENDECPCVKTFTEEREIAAALMVLSRSLHRVVIAEVSFDANGNIDAVSLTLEPRVMPSRDN